MISLWAVWEDITAARDAAFDPRSDPAKERDYQFQEDSQTFDYQFDYHHLTINFKKPET